MFKSAAWSRVARQQLTAGDTTYPVAELIIPTVTTAIVPLDDLSVTSLEFAHGVQRTFLLCDYYQSDGSLYGEVGDDISMDIRCVAGGLSVTNNGLASLTVTTRRL